MAASDRGRGKYLNLGKWQRRILLWLRERDPLEPFVEYDHADPETEIEVFLLGTEDGDVIVTETGEPIIGRDERKREIQNRRRRVGTAWSIEDFLGRAPTNVAERKSVSVALASLEKKGLLDRLPRDKGKYTTHVRLTLWGFEVATRLHNLVTISAQFGNSDAK